MYKSWAFTIRPREGFHEELETKLIKWISKQDYGFACVEMEGDARHCHAQIWINTPRDKGTINRSLENLCVSGLKEKFDASSKVVLRRGTKIAYNDDFIEEYLAKEDNIIYNNPPEDTSVFYPTKEEQEKVMAKKNTKNSKYLECKTQFLEKGNEVTLENVAIFVRDGMYKNDTITIIEDDRKRKQFVKSLFYYIKGSCSLSAMMTKEDFEEMLLKKQFYQAEEEYEKQCFDGV